MDAIVSGGAAGAGHTLTDQAPNPDTVKLGDGTNVAAFTANGLKVDVIATVGSTAAKQDTGNTSLASIDTKTPALASGRVPVDGSGVTQPVSGTFWQATQPVSAAALPLPSGAATDATVSTMSGKLPASVGQKAMAASLPVVIASDQSIVPVSFPSVTLTGSAAALNADVIASTDVSIYGTISLAIAGTWTGTITFQGSNDNFATQTYSITASSPSSGTFALTTSTAATGLFLIPVQFRYFRARMTAWTSGTATATAVALPEAAQDLGQRTVILGAGGSVVGSVTQSGTWTIQAQQAAATAKSVKSAQITVGLTAVRATTDNLAVTAGRVLLRVRPADANTGKIYMGTTTVSTSTGILVYPGESTDLLMDAGEYYLISDTAGQTVYILEQE